jgi:hypothetical protein
MTRKSLGRFRFGRSLRIQDAPICHNLPMCGRYFASIFLCLCLAAPAFAQGADSSSLEIYNGCGMEGDARSPGVQALNRLKNRYTAPQQFDPAITLAAMLAPGRDTGRWKVKKGAEIIGYVSDVKVGGTEHQLSCACCRATRYAHRACSRPNGRFPYPARRRGGHAPLAGNHGCSRGGLVNAGVARQAAGTLDQG